jgi:hypothetical protein
LQIIIRAHTPTLVGRPPVLEPEIPPFQKTTDFVQSAFEELGLIGVNEWYVGKAKETFFTVCE